MVKQGDEPGEVVGLVSGLKIGSEKVSRPPRGGSADEAAEVQAVLFVPEGFDLEDVLDNVEIVGVDVTTLHNIVERRT